jgi:hypothetical protein
MRLENNRRDSRARENPEYVSSAEGLSVFSGLGDQTDIQNKHFRYSGWVEDFGYARKFGWNWYQNTIWNTVTTSKGIE